MVWTGKLSSLSRAAVYMLSSVCRLCKSLFLLSLFALPFVGLPLRASINSIWQQQFRPGTHPGVCERGTLFLPCSRDLLIEKTVHVAPSGGKRSFILARHFVLLFPLKWRPKRTRTAVWEHSAVVVLMVSPISDQTDLPSMGTHTVVTRLVSKLCLELTTTTVDAAWCSTNALFQCLGKWLFLLTSDLTSVPSVSVQSKSTAGQPKKKLELSAHFLGR